MGLYKRMPYCIGKGSMVLSPNRMGPHPVSVRPQLPGAVIVVHGVNDVGTSYSAVEEGLCKGLTQRMGYNYGRSPFRPGTYRNYNPAKDAKALLDDPDAVFYKRQFDEDTHSPVIPFYWGFRETNGAYKSGEETAHGQAADRYGNRLDKDLSKGGGPFNNATNNLIDMWSSGASKLSEVVDRVSEDPLRPMLQSPGRLYMVLAAKRLAALISMIRDYNASDRVSIVAHSQGCLVSLLAQAFLMDQPQYKPADTLILTHPPYGLGKGKYTLTNSGGGTDADMAKLYEQIEGLQTLRARLDTLIRIVNGVGKNRSTMTAEDLKYMREKGITGGLWRPEADRDNRGKVYLYFCPEDMTVALPSVQGIGWQGVPYDAQGTGLKPKDDKGKKFEEAGITRHPLKELGPHFYQRVFTAKRRPVKGQPEPQPFKVGQTPQDFVLRQEGEDDHAHVAPAASTLRAELPETDRDGKKYLWLPLSEQEKRHGLRYISGEALPEAVPADMHAGARTLRGSPKGAHEPVDAIDAATALTSRFGLETHWALMDDPQHPIARTPERMLSPRPALHAGTVRPLRNREGQMAAVLNEGKDSPQDHRQVVSVYACLQDMKFEYPVPTGKLLFAFKESPNEARLRYQQSTSERSFHGAIIGGAKNHEHVTAYDVAVGRADAASDPKFYAYLCAVADWRLKMPERTKRPRVGILAWDKFLERHALYWQPEPDWRKQLIEGNCTYYSTGVLPKLPLVDELPTALVSETDKGVRIDRSSAKKQGGQA